MGPPDAIFMTPLGMLSEPLFGCLAGDDSGVSTTTAVTSKE